MKNRSFIAIFTLSLICRNTPLTFAQWTEIPTPVGAYIYEDLEVLGDKVYTAFFNNSRVKCLHTEDYLHWSLNADLPASGTFGIARVIPDGERLYLFGYNKNQQTANAWRSEDGGQNWSAVNLPTPAPYYLAALGNISLCASDFTVNRSTDDGATWSTVLTLTEKVWDMKKTAAQTVLITTSQHVYRSADQGLTWDVLPAPYNTSGVNYPYLVIYPTENAIFVEFDSMATSKLYRTVDQGTTWDLVQIPSQLDYASLDDLISTENTLWGIFSEGIATSADNGNTWNFRLTPEGSYQLAAKGDTVFAGGSTGFFKSYDQAGSWISGNSGWAEAGIPIAPFFSPDAIFADPSRIYLSTYEGLYATDNDGVEWTLFNSSGPITHHFNTSDTSLFLGFGALHSYDDGATWNEVRAGDYYSPLSGYYNFEIVDNYLITNVVFEDTFFRSHDLGLTWQTLLSPVFYPDYMAGAGNMLYLANYDGIYTSEDFGDSFQPFNSNLGNSPNIDGLWGYGAHIFTLVDDQLWRREGNQWRPASAGLFDETGNLPYIHDVGGELERTLLVAQKESGQPLLYLSGDGGASWEGNWADGLPDLEFEYQSLLSNGILYAMGETGSGEAKRIWKRELPVRASETAAEGNRIRLFPNPADDFSRLTFSDEAAQGAVRLYDFSGRLLWQQQIGGERFAKIPVKNLPAGIYNVSVYFENGQLKQTKLVVAH